MAKMDKDATKVAVVFFDPMVERANVRLVEETQDLFLERAAPFAGNDLDQVYFTVNRLLDDIVERGVNLLAAVVNVV